MKRGFDLPLSNKRRIVLVGGLPPPIGGVTSYLLALAEKVNDLVVYDVYPRVDKMPLFPNHHICPRYLSWCWSVWLLVKISLTKNSIIHFNFSSDKVMLLLPFIWKRGNKFILQFHHGDPFGMILRGGLSRKIFQLLIKKVDGVLVLGSRQLDLLSANSHANLKIKIGGSYFSDIVGSSSQLSSVCSRFVLSGYPLDIYRIKETINYFSQHSQVELIICLYGSSDDYIDRYLGPDIPSNCQVRKNLVHSQFLSVLRSCDCYLRPNSVDSFGIAVAEAVEMGLNVIASDVCERYAGAYIFPVDDMTAYYSAIFSLIEGRRPNLPISTMRSFSIDDYVNFIGSLQ